MRTCLGRAAVATLVMAACTGCTVAPDARCLSSRPAWSFHDTQPVKAKKVAAARGWDRQCTLVGVINSAADGR